MTEDAESLLAHAQCLTLIIASTVAGTPSSVFGFCIMPMAAAGMHGRLLRAEHCCQQTTNVLSPSGRVR